MRPWNEFLLDGLDLNLVRGAGGSWQLRGLASGDSSDSGDPGALLGLGALTLRNISLSVDDAVSGRQFRFGADEVRLINFGDTHRVAARVRSLQTKSAPFDTVIEYDSGKDTGVVYVGGASLDIAAILHGYPLFARDDHARDRARAGLGSLARRKDWRSARRGRSQRPSARCADAGRAR
jgi:hypothetical protein